MTVNQDDKYWKIVEQSLCKFWGLPIADARSQVRDFKKEVLALKISDAIYHDEPYHTACTIAGDDGDYEKNWKKYLELRNKIFKESSSVVNIDREVRKKPIVRERTTVYGSSALKPAKKAAAAKPAGKASKPVVKPAKKASNKSASKPATKTTNKKRNTK